MVARGSILASSGFSRSTRAQKAWMVDTCAARSSRRTRSQYRRSPPVARSSSTPRRTWIFCFISAAAFSVNVMARMRPTSSTRGMVSGRGRRRWRKRWASTVVLPEPAPARTATEPSARMASHCSGVGSRSGIARLVLEWRGLVATDAAIRAPGIAGIGIDVETTSAGARAEGVDVCGDVGLEKGPREALDQPLLLTPRQQHEEAALQFGCGRDAGDVVCERAEQVDGELEGGTSEVPVSLQRGGVAAGVACHLVVEDAEPLGNRALPLDLHPVRHPVEHERRSSSRIGERELDRLLEPALDREPLLVALLLRRVLADDQVVEPGCKPEPGEVEEGAVLGRDRRRADRLRLREEGGTQGARRLAVGGVAGMLAQEGLE